MRRALRAAGCVLIVAGVAHGVPAAACSMSGRYKVPTNLELVAAADTIVIATVESARKGADDNRGTLVVRPTALLKGEALPDVVELGGAMIADDDQMSRLVVASAPRELRDPNPGALIGACVRYVFRKDMKLVLFLKRDGDGRLVPYRSAFSRDAEDVADDNALWVKTVREYVPISLAPHREWKQRLGARMVELRADPADADARAIADDMQVEVSGKRLPPFD